MFFFSFFFFQAEDGIRDIGVTGVQTCALPILAQVAIVKQKKHTRAWRPGEKATLRNLLSETDEHGQQRLAQVATFKQKKKRHKGVESWRKSSTEKCTL